MTVFRWSMLTLVLVVSLVAGSISCGEQAAPSWRSPSEPTIVSTITGEVLVLKAGTANWSKVSLDMALGPGDRIKTGPGSNAVITFFEGSTVELSANTEISVTELGITERTSSTVIKLWQQIGKTTSRVKKLIDPASRYEIGTPDGAALVRGSVGDVVVTEDNSTTIVNKEGQWFAIVDGHLIPIPQGYQLTFVRGQLTVPVPVPVPPPPILPPPPPLPLPPLPLQLPPLPPAQWQTWIQTTVDDFNAGARHRVVIINVGGGDGTVMLASNLLAPAFLDQSNLSYSENLSHMVYGTHYLAQTFRAGMTGDIAKVALYLEKIGYPQSLLVEFRDCVVRGREIFPGNRVYASVTADYIYYPQEYEFLFPRPCTVVAGAGYCIVLHQQGNGGSNDNYYKWYGDTDKYRSGMAWQSDNSGVSWQRWALGRQDFYFATFVKGHYLLGTLESTSHDCGNNAEYGTIFWDKQGPGVTDLKLQIATNSDDATWNFVGPDGTLSTYYGTSGTDIWPGHDGDRYIKYRAYFRTVHPSQTPELEEVRITYR